MAGFNISKEKIFGPLRNHLIESPSPEKNDLVR